MGMIGVRLLSVVVLAALTVGSALAVPKLRLTETTIGPISIATGANGPLQSVRAFNAGDGQLNLTVTSSVPWLTPVVRPAVGCALGGGTCVPIEIGLSTAGAAAGVQTGILTVADPNAFDAPQTITVTVMIGGGVPDRADFFVSPNGSSETLLFKTNSELSTSVTTQSGGPWLSVGIDGSGSFFFVFPYRIEARHLAGLPEGTYNGSVNVTNSNFAQDIKNVPVTLRVTSEPIAQLTPAAVSIKIAQGLERVANVVVGNRGLGTLSITGAQTATVDGGDWLSAQKLDGLDIISVTVNTENLAVGLFQGAVTVEANAVNGPLEVPVRVEVVAPAAPIASFNGVVNNSTFEGGDPLPQGGIAAVFGEQLSFQAAQEGTELPLVTSLGGTQVFVNGIAAPLFFTSYSQINLQFPFEIPPGEATVVVLRDGQAGNTVTVQVVERAARILLSRVGETDYGIATLPDGAVAWPPELGGRAARPGEALVLWAIGLGQSQPGVATGTAAPGAEPLARIVPQPTAFFGAGLTGGAPSAPFFVGMAPGFVGLYQINVFIPANAPRGLIPVRIEGPGILSNTVFILVQ